MSANGALSASTGRAARASTSDARQRRYLLRITVVSTLGGLLFGYDTGVISGALLYMREDLNLTPLSQATVVSSLLFGAAVGALLGGKLADALGRKGSLLVCAVLFLVGAVGSALSPNVQIMVVSRVVLGLAVGAASATVPLFLAEMAPAHRRGRIVTINELMIVSGQMLAFIVNAALDRWFQGAHMWRGSTGLGASASLVATIAVGVISVTMTILGIYLLGFMNRRPLLITGFSGVAASQLALALVFLLPQSTTRSYIVLAAMVLFVVFVQCLLGIGVWLLLSEIFPLAIRGFAMGIAVFVLWVTNTTISFVFPLLNAALGATSTFGLFVVINIVSVLFVSKFVPETRGRTLEELEDDIREHDVRHLSHLAPAGVRGS